VEQFRTWLNSQVATGIVQQTQSAMERQWWNRYVEAGYAKGAGRAFDDTRKPALQRLDFYAGSKQEFLRSAFGQPESVEKVKLLAGRVFTDLKGVTEAMGTQITRSLTDGLVQGQNPRVIARTIAKNVDTIGRTRARTIARTEIIRAHAEGQLDALVRLGVDKVGVMVEWHTAGDDRVCQLCLPLQGAVLTIKEARGTLPRHPNCRCAFVPANVDENKRGQKRSKTELIKARDESIKAEIPTKSKRTIDQQRKLSHWPGADLTPAKTRPESILDAPLGSGPQGPPEHFKQFATAEEKKEFNQLIKERNLLNKQIKAGSGDQQRIVAVKARIKELKDIAKKRAGGILPPPPKPTIQPITPPPAVIEPPVAPIKTATGRIEDVLKDHPELNELLGKVNEVRLANAGDVFTMQGEIASLDARIHGLNREYSDAWSAYLKEIENVPVSERVMFSKTPAGSVFNDKLMMMNRERDMIKERLKQVQEATNTGIRRLLEVPDGQRMRFTSTRSTESVRAGGGRKGMTVKGASKDYDKKLEDAKDWLGRMSRSRSGATRIHVTAHRLRSGQRAFQRSGGIYLDAADGTSTFVHEIMHHFEHEVPNAYARANEFKQMRIARAGTRDVDLRQKFGRGYDPGEIGNEDGWGPLYPNAPSYAHYVGKTYYHGSTEVLTMGSELLYNNPAEFARIDPEFFKFMVGILRGYF
jgi:SPP1 gp7 family putative phage head morphogenesis protein